MDSKTRLFPAPPGESNSVSSEFDLRTLTHSISRATRMSTVEKSKALRAHLSLSPPPGPCLSPSGTKRVLKPGLLSFCLPVCIAFLLIFFGTSSCLLIYDSVPATPCWIANRYLVFYTLSRRIMISGRNKMHC